MAGVEGSPEAKSRWGQERPLPSWTGSGYMARTTWPKSFFFLSVPLMKESHSSGASSQCDSHGVSRDHMINNESHSDFLTAEPG